MEAQTKACKISGNADVFAAVYVDEVQKGMQRALTAAGTQECLREQLLMEPFSLSLIQEI